MAGLEARGQESAGGRRGAADTAATAAADATTTTTAAASSVTAVMRGADICIHKKIYESDSMHTARVMVGNLKIRVSRHSFLYNVNF